MCRAIAAKIIDAGYTYSAYHYSCLSNHGCLRHVFKMFQNTKSDKVKTRVGSRNIASANFAKVKIVIDGRRIINARNKRPAIRNNRVSDRARVSFDQLIPYRLSVRRQLGKQIRSRKKKKILLVVSRSRCALFEKCCDSCARFFQHRADKKFHRRFTVDSVIRP